MDKPDPHPPTTSSSQALQPPSKNSPALQSRETITLKATALMKLAAHYHRPDFGPAAAASVVEDMLLDLSEFSTAEVERACMQWRTSPERFFPTSGQLIAVIRPKNTFELPARRLAKFEGYPEPQQRATKSVAQVLREHGMGPAADRYEAWKASHAK